MNTIDTRDLITERDELKQQILDDFNEKFSIEATDFDDIDNILEENEFVATDDTDGFLEYWTEEYEKINEINELEYEIGSREFDYGINLIEEDDFEEYCEELVKDIGDLPSDLPSYIQNNIDWSGVADDLQADYSSVDFRGESYLYRE